MDKQTKQEAYLDAKALLDCAAVLAWRAAEKILAIGYGIDDTDRWLEIHELAGTVENATYSLRLASDEMKRVDPDDYKEEDKDGT